MPLPTVSYIKDNKTVVFSSDSTLDTSILLSVTNKVKLWPDSLTRAAIPASLLSKAIAAFRRKGYIVTKKV